MPCYCDTPDSDDQVEIERRCKFNMYQNAIYSLTREQAQEAERLELKMFPIGNANEHLCKICKLLTKDQMQKVSAYYYDIKWPHKTLYDWHVQHCLDDLRHNEVKE